MLALSCQQQALAESALVTIDKVLQLQPGEQQRLTVTAQQRDYFRGEITSDTAVATIAITSTPTAQSAESLVKQLASTPVREQEVFWQVAEDGQYNLLIQATNKPATVSVHLQQMALKASQYVSPARTVISPTLKALIANLTDKNHARILAQFWQERQEQGTPMLEYTASSDQVLATFLWRGEADNVRLFGAPYEGHTHLTHIENSDIWFVSYSLPKETRLSYQFAPNVPQLASDVWFEQRRAVLATLVADPLNPHQWQVNPQGNSMSILQLENAPDSSYTIASQAPVGTLHRVKFYSDILHNERDITLYTPNPSILTEQPAQLLITFDGDEYQSKIPTPVILDNLIAQKKIPPTYAVLINNPQPSLRATELPPNPDFADFMANELLPWVKDQFKQPFVAENVIVTGSSFGGLASLYLAFSYPQNFGKVLSQSGSFWWAPAEQPAEWLTRQIEQSATQPIQIYLNAGLFEVAPEFANILQTNRNLYQLLRQKGYPVYYKEFANGHDYFSWRTNLADGLITLAKSGTTP